MDYDLIGDGYRRVRRPDPRIAAIIASALGSARSVINVGAGAGAYEPVGPRVVAVEPSALMMAQREPRTSQVLRGHAERLPVGDCSFDAAMAIPGPGTRSIPMPIPWDCTDGVLGAYWRRPRAYLDPQLREGISSLVVPDRAIESGLARLAADLDSGRWRRRNGELLRRRELDVGYRLLVGDAALSR